MEFPYTSELFKPEKGEAFFDTKRGGFAGRGRGFNRGRGGAIPPPSDRVHRGPPLMYKVNPGNWVLKENDLEGAKFIWKNFESRKSDVWIVTPPKVIFQLFSKFDKCNNMYEVGHEQDNTYFKLCSQLLSRLAGHSVCGAPWGFIQSKNRNGFHH